MGAEWALLECPPKSLWGFFLASRSGFSARVPRGVLVHGVESGFSARLHHGVLGARRGAGVLCSGLSRGSRGAAWDRGAHALAS